MSPEYVQSVAEIVKDDLLVASYVLCKHYYPVTRKIKETLKNCKNTKEWNSEYLLRNISNTLKKAAEALNNEKYNGWRIKELLHPTTINSNKAFLKYETPVQMAAELKEYAKWIDDYIYVIAPDKKSCSKRQKMYYQYAFS